MSGYVMNRSTKLLAAVVASAIAVAVGAYFAVRAASHSATVQLRSKQPTVIDELEMHDVAGRKLFTYEGTISLFADRMTFIDVPPDVADHGVVTVTAVIRGSSNNARTKCELRFIHRSCVAEMYVIDNQALQCGPCVHD